jgi:hypothetical protein
MRHAYLVALAGGVALAATAGPAVAAVVTTPTFIAVPADAANVQPLGAFSSFDISFADPVTGDIFIADRSNASVDIFSGSSQTFLGRATGFTGQQATTSVSGADGVLTVTSGGITTLYAGDGNSTLKVFQFTNPASPGSAVSSIATGSVPTTRVDEMAYSPAAGGRVLAANNAATPAFANLFQTASGHEPVSLISAFGVGIQVPTSQGGIAGGGMEQPAWNPTTGAAGAFFVSIPQLAGGSPPNPNDPGGVSEIDTSGNVLRTIDFTSFGIASCSPTGLAVSTGGNMLVGCGGFGTQAVLLDKNGNFIKTVGAGVLGGTDEIWYDPRTNEFYVTGNNNTNTGRFFDIVDANGNIIQTVSLPATTSAHSITVDPFNGDVFVALAGTGALDPCPSSFENPGCIAVFAQAAAAVPEPSTLPLLAIGLVGLIGLSVRRQLQ